MTTTSSIEETLIDWFGKNALEIKDLQADEERIHDDRPHLYKALGSFYPVSFDKDYDGMDLALMYHQEIALQDERFFETKLSFPTDTTFKIV